MTRGTGVSELEHHVGYWMRFVSNHVSHSFKVKVESRGVTVAEWVLLRHLLGSGPVSPSRVATDLGMTRGAISKLVERLCGKGLVERASGGADLRYQSVSLTAKGRRLVPALGRLADDNDAEMFGHMAPRKRAELVAMLEGIVRHHGWKDIPVE